jgi:ubiquinone/menaquinone biosynthesis C-methylase UbiE
VTPTTSSRTPDYGRVAAVYDRLRPQDEGWWELFELLVAAGDFQGRRVLDVGCGTGRWSEALAERGSRVWGVDESPEMVELARKRGVNAKLASAEALPFKEAWFERALLVLVVHVLDRPRAFAELHRVLADDGRIAIATFARAQFDSYYLSPYFPSLAQIDRERFPTPEALEEELGAAGFSSRTIPVHQRTTISREWALERIRGRFISTLLLIGDEEFAEGLARAERELPERIEAEQHLLAVVADAVRPPL